MKKIIPILSLALRFLAADRFAQDNAVAKNQHRQGNTHYAYSVDADGDGYNDNAPDADGDGIPNGMDDDYTSKNGGSGNTFVDADGDGINDNARDADGEGIANGMDDDFVRGTGLGNTNNGSVTGGQGLRDGTGNGNKPGGKR